ncbi:subclass B3 metallo-beta-lactamase [Sphingomonas jatrophae]|uniref:Metallo-beta-lactamase class B n=1 Tax=Sphingomonas jatrophae TaxID=1166337 RepID=A0A1I6LJQ0_9SPHN|nr:subclass B3 metallo-beta-lactamase [Sphingomonas jatrophae]SFS03694.1 metallo-beta-lactamase class B [Sphingomonas jatrophae]
MTKYLSRGAALLLALAAPAQAADPPAWSRPTAPFHVVGPIWYVGTKGLASWLIRTSAGAILIDGTLERNVPAIERNIRSLGVPLSSVKLLLNSHAHFDHAGGLARLKRDTGARLLASAADRSALESGIPPSETSYGVVRFPPVKVDESVRAADFEPGSVKLGEVSLTPKLTSGHTPGCTTWWMTVKEQGRDLRVIFPCSLSVAGNKLVGNRGYPGIVDDYRRSFWRLRRFNADVVLPAHPEQVDLLARAARARRGERDAFLMPGLLQRMVTDAEMDFETALRAEQL